MARISSVLPLFLTAFMIVKALFVMCELHFGFESLTAHESSILASTEHSENSVSHAHEHQRSDTEKDGCGDHDRTIIGVVSLRTLAPIFDSIIGFLMNRQEVPAHRQTVASERLSRPGVTIPLSSQANPISLRL